jgi:RNA polymerase sigma-70 factor (ECF subfamily)
VPPDAAGKDDRLKRLTDTELAMRAQGGDGKAFEEIYERHASGVARALASFAGPDRDVLDDLTQETFFRVIAGLPSYMPRRPFVHWLYTIALNVGRNHVRRRSRVTAVDPVEIDSLGGGRDPAGCPPEHPLGHMLVAMVSRLPDHMREVVSMRIGSDMPYAEIAEMLGIEEGTARTRMHHAIKRLRDQLQVLAEKKEKR